MPKSYVTGSDGKKATYYTSADLISTPQGYRDPVTGALFARGGYQERDDAWEDEQGVWHLGDMPTDYQAPPEDTKPDEAPPDEAPPAETAPPPSDTGGGGGGYAPPPDTSTDYGGFKTPPPKLPDYGGGVPSYVPETPVFTPPTYTPPPAFSFRDYVAPDKFTYADYVPTTAADLYADPSYQFRVDQGLQALTNSAAARGIANTGGTLKDFLNYGQNAASQEFGAVDTRRLGDYRTNRGNAFDNWQANAAQGVTDYNTARGAAVDTYNTNYATQYQDPYKIAYQAAVDEFAPKMTAYQTQAQAGQHESDQNRYYDYQTWLQQYNMWRNNRTDTFNEISAP
jgi:hypothetical protein